MKSLRGLLLGACAVAVPLALAVGARAAEPGGRPMVLYDAAGHPVVVLMVMRPTEGVASSDAGGMAAMIKAMDADMAAPFGDGFVRMMAAQEAAMREMMGRMDALASQAFKSVPADSMQFPVPRGVGQVFVSTFSSGGQGACSETITYRNDGSGAAPQVAVRRVGDGCGAVTAPGTRVVPTGAPREAKRPDVVGTPGGRVYRVDYRHPAVTTNPPIRG